MHRDKLFPVLQQTNRQCSQGASFLASLQSRRVISAISMLVLIRANCYRTAACKDHSIMPTTHFRENGPNSKSNNGIWFRGRACPSSSTCPSFIIPDTHSAHLQSSASSVTWSSGWMSVYRLVLVHLREFRNETRDGDTEGNSHFGCVAFFNLLCQLSTLWPIKGQTTTTHSQSAD